MNVFELFAKIKLDKSEYDEGLGEASEKSHKFGNAIKSGLATATKATVAGIGVAVAGVTALTKSAVESYANYEQLIGGVETLFKDSAGKLEEYAYKASETAGMSANDYMETVTSFSASLLQSLGGDTEKAVDYADMAIRDMSDNANKMGSDMSSIQNAYQGFAKQNYTMLDNLKLGYGGTKEEMQRLLDDASKLSGIKYDISSYSDIVDAIHVVQTEMGITGTTAKEASSTISGSLNMVKADWDNLVLALAQGDIENIGDKFSKITKSASTAFKNILPIAEQALTSIGELIETAVPILLDEIPKLLQDIVPKLLDVAINLVSTIGQAIMDNLPILLDSVIALVSTLGSYIMDNLPLLIESAIAIIVQLATAIVQALPKLIPYVVKVILQIVETLLDNIDMLIDVAIDLILALTEGLIDALPILIDKAPVIIAKFVEAIIRNLPKILNAGYQVLGQLVGGIISAIPNLINAVGSIRDTINNGIATIASNALTWGKDMIDNFINGIKSKIGNVKDVVKNLASSIKDYIGFSEPKLGPLSNFHTYAPDMIDLFTQGIEQSKGIITDALADTFAMPAQTVPSVQVAKAETTNQNVQVNITLAGDADGIFRVVRQESRKFNQATGRSAFA